MLSVILRCRLVLVLRGLTSYFAVFKIVLIDFGYVTTRVVVEPQDLRSGMLVLTVIPGKVGRIQLQDQSAIPFATRGTLWFAMPMAQGDILNIRNIEQGLENLKRVPSADANMELVPTDAVGETDVVIAYKQAYLFI